MARITRKRYTEEELDLIKRMIADGATDRQIARATGRKTHAIANKRYYLKNQAQGVSRVRSKDATALVELIVKADVPKSQKLKCLEALL